MKSNKNIFSPFAFTVIVLICLLFIFFEMGLRIVAEHEDHFHYRTFRYFGSILHRGWLPFYKFITFFGLTTFLAPAFVFIIVFILLKERGAGLISATIIILTNNAVTLLEKLLYARTRPGISPINENMTFSFFCGNALIRCFQQSSFVLSY